MAFALAIALPLAGGIGHAGAVQHAGVAGAIIDVAVLAVADCGVGGAGAVRVQNARTVPDAPCAVAAAPVVAVQAVAAPTRCVAPVRAEYRRAVN